MMWRHMLQIKLGKMRSEYAAYAKARMQRLRSEYAAYAKEPLDAVWNRFFKKLVYDNIKNYLLGDSFEMPTMPQSGLPTMPTMTQCPSFFLGDQREKDICLPGEDAIERRYFFENEVVPNSFHEVVPNWFELSSRTGFYQGERVYLLDDSVNGDVREIIQADVCTTSDLKHNRWWSWWKHTSQPPPGLCTTAAEKTVVPSEDISSDEDISSEDIKNTDAFSMTGNFENGLSTQGTAGDR